MLHNSINRIFTLAGIFLTLLTSAHSSSAVEKTIREKLFSGGMYDKGTPPGSANPDDTATTVNVNIFISDIPRISDVEMEYTIQMIFRMEWLDSRLAYKNLMGLNKINYLTLPTHSQSDIWIPDLFFSNEKRSHTHDLMLPNKYVRINPDGTVIHSSRLTMTLSCPMMLKLYPFDMQTCSLQMESYGSTTDGIVFKWKENNPIAMTTDLHLPRYALSRFEHSNCDSYTTTGHYSCLRLDFDFRRELNFYIMQVFIPSCMMVIIGWLSFWLDHKSAAGRLNLCLVTLLVNAVMVLIMNEGLPPVSYAKAMDVWTGVCLSFLFFTLAEFVLVNYLARKNGDEDENMRSKSNCVKYTKTPSVFDGFDSWTLSDTIDTIARVLYPVFFVFFVIIYVYNYTPDYKV